MKAPSGLQRDGRGCEEEVGRVGDEREGDGDDERVGEGSMVGAVGMDVEKGWKVEGRGE